jgi:hypothetical protein
MRDEQFVPVFKVEGKVWRSPGGKVFTCARKPETHKHGAGALWWKRKDGAGIGGHWLKDVGIWE